MAESRWSARFLALIEGMSPPEPLRAGRALARTEAVLSVRRSGNLVVAMVRDQGEDLHKARLAVRTFGDADWGRVERALASQARYAAALLAGSMPAGVEDVFAVLGLSLLPTRADDLAMDCTCADWQRPGGTSGPTPPRTGVGRCCSWWPRWPWSWRSCPTAHCSPSSA